MNENFIISVTKKGNFLFLAQVIKRVFIGYTTVVHYVKVNLIIYYIRFKQQNLLYKS